MNKLLVTFAAAISIAATGSTRAADMPAKAPLYRAPPASTWGGCHAGIEGGGNFGEANVFNLLTDKFLTNRFKLRGGLFGGTFGCDWQYAAHWVIGIEDDISWTSKGGSAANLGKAPTTTNSVSERWIDTLRGRIGLAVDHALLYATGGAAFAGSALDVCGNAGCFSQTLDRSGWVVGFGVEWTFAPQWTTKVEYLHADFGEANYTAMPSPPVDGRRVLLSDDMFRAGINYRFYPW
jgi:outer membrane immunogenic protein